MAGGTRWARLDVDYFANPKARAAGAPGRALHLASICWSAAQLTDGHVPPQMITALLSQAEVSRRAVALVLDSGLWLPNGHGYQIKGFDEYQPSREQVEREREQTRRRQQRHRGRDEGGRYENGSGVTP